MTKQDEPVTLFYSYAHEDEKLHDKLEKHLSQLRRQGIISEWDYRKIRPGEVWTHEINTYLETATIILLLISPDFLGSDYCYNNELQRAFERHERGEARVIPIILRPCDWQHSPLKDLQCLPRNGKPVTTWDNPDTAFLDITNGLHRVIELEQGVDHPAATLLPHSRQNRIRMLKLVREIWIEGVLERSLHQAALKALDLQKEPDALDNPWHIDVQETNQPSRSLLAGTSLIQVYDEADGLLLILGKPGAGKTTLLLQLARTLLERAEKDKRQRIPIVFNLTSWAKKREPLSIWMVEELSKKYYVPPKVAQYWIDTDQILPLLDGLDEVTEKETRTICAQQINNYYRWRREKEYGDSPIVVCCRSKEYAALSRRSTRVKLMLRHAVSIRDLTDKQINTYLEQVGEQAKALKQALSEDTELNSLARQPLMLNILTLAYQGATVVPARETHEKMRHTIFATYVDRMLKRRGQSKRWKPEQVTLWLIFLAKQMQQNHQTVFSVEDLQPIWLPRKWRLFYEWCMGPIIGLVCGLTEGLAEGLGSGLFAGLVCGVVFVWIEESFGMLLPRNLLPEHPLFPNEGTWREGARGLSVALVSELVGGSLFGLIGWLLFRQPRFLAGELVFLPFLVLGPFIRHFLLRFFLLLRGDLPWNLVPFLDNAAERLLLRKLGGSYMFVHRQLLDYFAALDGPIPSESTFAEGEMEKAERYVQR